MSTHTLHFVQVALMPCGHQCCCPVCAPLYFVLPDLPAKCAVGTDKYSTHNNSSAPVFKLYNSSARSERTSRTIISRSVSLQSESAERECELERFVMSRNLISLASRHSRTLLELHAIPQCLIPLHKL